MVRTPYFDKNGLKKGAWTREEDEKLRAYITRYGIWNWRQLPKYAGLPRCGKSCRLRWINYLRPGVKHGNYSKEEEDLITKLHQEHGNKWSLIAAKLPGRTDNEIKNHWHTRLKKCTEQDQNKSGHGQLKSTEQPREEASQTRISENRDVVMEAAESGSANSSTSPFHSTFGSNSTLCQQTMYPSEEFPDLSFIDAESGSANSSTSPFHSTFGSNSTLYQQTMYPSEEFPGLSFIDAAAEVEVPAAGTNWNDAEGSLTSFEYSSTDFWTAPFLPDNTFYNQDSCSSFSEGGPVPSYDSYFDDNVDFLYQVMQDFP